MLFLVMAISGVGFALLRRRMSSGAWDLVFASSASGHTAPPSGVVINGVFFPDGSLGGGNFATPPRSGGGLAGRRRSTRTSIASGDHRGFAVDGLTSGGTGGRDAIDVGPRRRTPRFEAGSPQPGQQPVGVLLPIDATTAALRRPRIDGAADRKDDVGSPPRPPQLDASSSSSTTEGAGIGEGEPGWLCPVPHGGAGTGGGGAVSGATTSGSSPAVVRVPRRPAGAPVPPTCLPPHTRGYVHLVTTREGMSAWTHILYEMLNLAKALNRTLVEPCVAGGELVPCVPGMVGHVPESVKAMKREAAAAATSAAGGRQAAALAGAAGSSSNLLGVLSSGASGGGVALPPALPPPLTAFTDPLRVPAFLSHCGAAGKGSRLGIEPRRHRSYPLSLYVDLKSLRSVWPHIMPFDEWAARELCECNDELVWDGKRVIAEVGYCVAWGPKASQIRTHCAPDQGRYMFENVWAPRTVPPSMPQWVREQRFAGHMFYYNAEVAADARRNVFFFNVWKGSFAPLGTYAKKTPRFNDIHAAAVDAWVAERLGGPDAPSSYAAFQWRSETVGEELLVPCAEKMARAAAPVIDAIRPRRAAGAAANSVGDGVGGEDGAAADADASGASAPSAPLNAPRPPGGVLVADIPSDGNPCKMWREYYGVNRGMDAVSAGAGLTLTPPGGADANGAGAEISPARRALRRLTAAGLVKYDADHPGIDSGVLSIRDWLLASRARWYVTCMGDDAKCKGCFRKDSKFVARVVQARRVAKMSSFTRWFDLTPKGLFSLAAGAPDGWAAAHPGTTLSSGGSGGGGGGSRGDGDGGGGAGGTSPVSGWGPPPPPPPQQLPQPPARVWRQPQQPRGDTAGASSMGADGNGISSSGASGSDGNNWVGGRVPPPPTLLIGNNAVPTPTASPSQPAASPSSSPASIATTTPGGSNVGADPSALFPVVAFVPPRPPRVNHLAAAFAAQQAALLMQGEKQAAAAEEQAAQLVFAESQLAALQEQLGQLGQQNSPAQAQPGSPVVVAAAVPTPLASRSISPSPSRPGTTSSAPAPETVISMGVAAAPAQQFLTATVAAAASV